MSRPQARTPNAFCAVAPWLAAWCVAWVAAAASAQAPPQDPGQPPAQPPADQAAQEETPDLAVEQPPTDPRPPTGTAEELDQIRPGIALKRRFDKLADETGFRFGMAHTMLLQQATGGPGDRTAAGGDLDLLAKWTAIGRGTKDTGILVGSTEYRYQIGDLPPAELSKQIGSLLPTTNGFGERPFVVKEFYWDQRLLDDRLRYAVGRIDPENLFGGHRLQSANTFFLNKAFSSNPTVAYPGPAVAGAVLVKPVEWAYIDAGLTDANGKANAAGIDTFFQNGEYLTFTEAGLTPKIEGLGAGRYRVAFWHIDAREDDKKPSDAGFTVSLDQDIGESVIVFARYGHADGDVTGVTNSVQAGAGFKDVLGKENMLGIAAAWSEPFAQGLRDEKVVEVFQRFQLTETIQFTVGVETIFEPSNKPDDDVVGVFSARLRFSF